jgi:predicted aminopeptidase
MRGLLQRFLLLSVTLLVAPGCGLEYYLGLAGPAVGSWLRMRPIEDVLDDPLIEETVKVRLELVRAVRRFAIDRLGMNDDGSFTYYDDDHAFVDGEWVGYILFASPRDSMSPFVWNVPFLGLSPYRSYFIQAAAEGEAARLRMWNHDTYIGEMLGFSSFFGIPVPLRSTQLRMDDYDLVSFLLHEMAHPTIGTGGTIAYAESAAEFVGRNGARLFFREAYGEQAAETASAMQRYFDRDLIDDFIGDAMRLLEEYYASPETEAEKIAGRITRFALISDRFHDEIRPGLFEPARYDRYGEINENNAFFSAYATYRGHRSVFDEVVGRMGGDLRSAIIVFRHAANTPDGFAFLEEWLGP